MTIKESFRANSTSASTIAVDGHSIIMYNKHIIKIEVINSFSEYHVSDIDFIATNIK
jgi:hypothetical protein